MKSPRFASSMAALAAATPMFLASLALGCRSADPDNAYVRECILTVSLGTYGEHEVTAGTTTQKLDGTHFHFHVSELGGADHVTVVHKGRVLDSTREVPVKFDGPRPSLEAARECIAITKSFKQYYDGQVTVKSAVGNVEKAGRGPLFAVIAPPGAKVTAAGTELVFEEARGDVPELDVWALALDPSAPQPKSKDDLMDLPVSVEIAFAQGPKRTEKVTLQATAWTWFHSVQPRAKAVAQGKPFTTSSAPANAPPSVYVLDTWKSYEGWTVVGSPKTFGDVTHVAIREEGKQVKRGRSCQFTTGFAGGAKTVTQMMIESIVRVYDARTAKLVTEQSFFPTSKECPTEITLRRGEGAYDDWSSLEDEIAPWLESEILGNKKPRGSSARR